MPMIEIRVRMPPDKRKQLVAIAKYERRTLSAVVRNFLIDCLKIYISDVVVKQEGDEITIIKEVAEK